MRIFVKMLKYFPMITRKAEIFDSKSDVVHVMTHPKASFLSNNPNQKLELLAK
jgi:hypothetical protein